MPEPLQCVYAGSLGSGQDLDALVAAARAPVPPRPLFLRAPDAKLPGGKSLPE